MSRSLCFSCVCSICACLDLFVSSSSCYLRVCEREGMGSAACDCGTPWTFSYPSYFGFSVK